MPVAPPVANNSSGVAATPTGQQQQHLEMEKQEQMMTPTFTVQRGLLQTEQHLTTRRYDVERAASHCTSGISQTIKCIIV